MRFKLTNKLVLVLSAALSIAALSSLSPVNADSPRRGGTLVTTVVPEPSVLVGLLTTADNTYSVGPKMTEGLVTYDWNLNPKPALATSWKVSADGKLITFGLRKGVKWHDGQPFTAEDVKFSIGVLKQNHPRGRATFANVDEIDTPDAHTVVLHLSKPAPYMFKALAASESPIVPQHVYAGTDVRANENNTKPIGTGPFMLKEWQKGSHIILERNPDYWDAGKPYLDRIIYRIIPDAAARAVALETGEIMLAGKNPVPLYDVQRLEKLDRLGIEMRGDAYSNLIHRIEFNLSNPYLKFRKVRQAIAYAIDKNFILQNIWFGYGDVTAGPIHPAISALYTEDTPKYPFDPKKSEQLLDEAGFKRGSDGVRFRLTHDYLPITDNFKRTAEYLKQALKKVGIEVDIRGQDFPTYVQRVYTKREFDFTNHWMNNTSDPTLGVQRLYWSKNFKPGVPFSNGSGYQEAEMDDLLVAAQTEIDPDKRATLWHQVAQMDKRDLPDYPLVGIRRVTIYNKKVQNHTVSPLGVDESFAELWIKN